MADLPTLEWTPLSEEELQKKQAIIEHLGAKAASVKEAVIIRFIRGYAREKKPLEKAIEMLDKALEWREKENVDSILVDGVPRIEEFHKIWHCECHGHDRQGHPIYYELTGRVSPDDLLKNFKIEDVAKFHIYNMERISALKQMSSEKEGKNIYKHIAILDLDGIGRKHMSSDFYGPMRKVLDIDQFFYPESLHRLYIINAGFLFRGLYAIISPWLHPITRERIQVLGSDYLPKLLEIIDADQLPAALGGKCDCKNLQNCKRVHADALVEEFVSRQKAESKSSNDASPAAAAAAASSSS